MLSARISRRKSPYIAKSHVVPGDPTVFCQASRNVVSATRRE